MNVYDVVFLVVCGKPINPNLGWFIIGLLLVDYWFIIAFYQQKLGYQLGFKNSLVLIIHRWWNPTLLRIRLAAMYW